MALQSPAPASSAAAPPAGHLPVAPPGRGSRRLAAATTPTPLRLLMGSLLLASLAWGAVGAWTVTPHASAAQDGGSVSEPPSPSARHRYPPLAAPAPTP